MISENFDIGIIGLQRIYNGKPKKITLINTNNVNTTIKYFDKDNNEVENGPIEIGEYQVVVETQNIKIKKKLVIQEKSNFKLDEK